tara:strand:- start:7760 stop:8089 length:330 start_codon:yes stop_codon:yes gene_type:complete
METYLSIIKLHEKKLFSLDKIVSVPDTANMKTKHPIAEYRKRNNLTLEEFGILAGVQKAAVCKWENGHSVPSVTASKKIDIATSGALPKAVLRPDVWAVDDTQPSEAAE